MRLGIRYFGQRIPAVLLCFAATAGEFEKPTFTAPVQSFSTPVQTGTGRAANISTSGLYQVPEGIDTVYSVGRALPALYERLVFLRAIDDFYTDKGVVWTGQLTYTGGPGAIRTPSPQALLAENGAFIAICRTEQDEEFQHNYMKECAPNWYFINAQNIIGSVKDASGTQKPNPVRVTVHVPKPAASGLAELRVALNSNAAKDKPNELTISLNGQLVVEKAVWAGPGYRVFRHKIDAALLRDGDNIIELIGDSRYVKFLDYVEISTPASPALRDGGLLLQAQTAGTLQMPGANYVVDVTDLGSEKAVGSQEDQAGAFQLEAGRLYYISNHHGALKFGPEITLAAPPIDAAKYVAVALRQNLPALEPLLRQKRDEGLEPAAVAFEDILNVYNGGMYGPDGLVAMQQQFKPEYLLIAGGFHRDARAREPKHAAQADWHPGIPTQVRHLEQLTIADDIYNLNNTLKVGRVPLNAYADLEAWAGKAASHTPAQRVILLAGKNDRVDFSSMQRTLNLRFPSALVEADSQEPAEVRRQLLGLMQADQEALVLYQGHAQSWAIDENLLDGSHAAALPRSSWVLATCNGAYYHGDFEVYARDWLKHPETAAVNVIAGASVGAADQQDQLLRKFLDRLAEEPSETWGGMMLFLKRNMPLDEKMMQDPNLPPFIKNTIPQDRLTIDGYSLLGDPAARILANTHAAYIKLVRAEDERGPFPHAPVPLLVTLDGAWDIGTVKENLALQWRKGNEAKWQPYNLESPLQPGENTVPFDSAKLNEDGGAFQVRLIEQREDLPFTTWAVTRFQQESTKPGVPTMRVQRMRRQTAQSPPAADADAGSEWLVCIATDRAGTHRPDTVFTQFQVREPEAPDEVLDDTGWLETRRFTYELTALDFEPQVRARIKKGDVEGAWSEWTALEAPEPHPSGAPAPAPPE